MNRGHDVSYGYSGKIPGKKPTLFVSDEEYYEMLEEAEEETTEESKEEQ